MAQSLAHKFGQIVGEVLEAAIGPLLREAANQYQLYLDQKGLRPARLGKRKVSWIDRHGNVHDLDYVMERGGTAEHVGIPVAFIESAWRRYTKHSRNKAQEIQGAILPLRETHHRAAPFMGVVLGGEFTKGSLDQLASLGFCVLHFPLNNVIEAFATVGVDANWSENTSEAEFEQKIRQWNHVPQDQKHRVAEALITKRRRYVQRFIRELERSITRQVASIRILPLHGTALECSSIKHAIEVLSAYDEGHNSHPVIKYEISLQYNNGDKIEGHFENRLDALQFLEQYQGPNFRPITGFRQVRKKSQPQ
jgi:hypothetical protein